MYDVYHCYIQAITIIQHCYHPSSDHVVAVMNFFDADRNKMVRGENDKHGMGREGKGEGRKEHVFVHGESRPSSHSSHMLASYTVYRLFRSPNPNLFAPCNNYGAIAK